ncbi:hypothetical protein VUR80DRAFT_5169 [Thermomyces stellatus]
MGKGSKKNKKAKQAAASGKYPVDFANPCERCQSERANVIAYKQAGTRTMEWVMEQLEAYRGKGDYIFILGNGHDPKNPRQGNPEAGIRFLNGKIEVWNKDATVSRPWSLDEQISWIKRYIAADDIDIKIDKLCQEHQSISCRINQLRGIIPYINSTDFNNSKVTGQTINEFVSPPAEENEAWIAALKEQAAKYHADLDALEAEFMALNELEKKHIAEDEVIKMEAEVKAMAASGKAAPGKDNAEKKSVIKKEAVVMVGDTEKDDAEEEGASQKKAATVAGDTKKDDFKGKATAQTGVPMSGGTGKAAGMKLEVVTVEPIAVHQGATDTKIKCKKKNTATKEAQEKTMVVTVKWLNVFKRTTRRNNPDEKATSKKALTGKSPVTKEKGIGEAPEDSEDNADSEGNSSNGDAASKKESIAGGATAHGKATQDIAVVQGVDNSEKGTDSEEESAKRSAVVKKESTDGGAEVHGEATNEAAVSEGAENGEVPAPSFYRVFTDGVSSAIVSMVKALLFALIVRFVTILVMKVLEAYGIVKRAT